MALDWNTIKTRAARFSAQFAKAKSERAEAQSFWNAFFDIFGIERRRVAAFEAKVAKLNKNPGFVDLFWPGVLLVEHKSAGEDLALAHDQALDYFLNLNEGEHPRYVLACDFQRFWLKDLDDGTEVQFLLADLAGNASRFGFLRGQQVSRISAADPINEKAVRKLSRLHDALRHDGYTGHELQLLLVRLLFCLFADRTGLFEPAGRFADLVENGSKPDGTDLGLLLVQLFAQLDTQFEKRQKSLPGWFREYPYVNGRLFEERIAPPAFNVAMRELLLDCCATDWSRISPAIFGSMFQRIIDLGGLDDAKDLRRELGAHYTSEENILKLIGPLFLDDLRDEFGIARRSAAKLFEFQKKLRSLTFFDPACGCGNFLVITYRELRRLELDVLRAVQAFGTRISEPFKAVSVNVDQFSGIELEEFPARVAQVAMWLTDHQMNLEAGALLETWLPRLPLEKSANIRIGNALNLDWEEFCAPESLHVILGNPPFIGKQFQTATQKADLESVLAGTTIAQGGVLDYVAGWYIKAANYLQGDSADVANAKKAEFLDAAFSKATQASIFEDPAETAARNSALDIYEAEERAKRAARDKIRVAFVSTNSICQGEQVAPLWGWLQQQGCRIEFAHRTFRWSNEASGQAAVHCVIVGFARRDAVAARAARRGHLRLFDYEDVNGTPIESAVATINPYLVDASDVVLHNRRKPLCEVPAIVFGSMPNDGGHLLLDAAERKELLALEPQARRWLRPFLGAEEFINGLERWCLWLKDCPPDILAKMPAVRKRLVQVRAHRQASARPATQRLAQTPQLFGEDRQPTSEFILVPSVSSEKRLFVPIGFVDKRTVASNLTLVVPEAGYFHFGVLTSSMHNAWLRHVCGRLESRYRYSAGIVYNNYPWPENPSLAMVSKVEAAAQAVLDMRAAFPDANLAMLYDPDTMPPELLRAHAKLDAAIDAAYGAKKMKTDGQRVAFLFAQYERLIAILQPAAEAADALTDVTADVTESEVDSGE